MNAMPTHTLVYTPMCCPLRCWAWQDWLGQPSVAPAQGQAGPGACGTCPGKYPWKQCCCSHPVPLPSASPSALPCCQMLAWLQVCSDPFFHVWAAAHSWWRPLRGQEAALPTDIWCSPARELWHVEFRAATHCCWRKTSKKPNPKPPQQWDKEVQQRDVETCNQKEAEDRNCQLMRSLWTFWEGRSHMAACQYSIRPPGARFHLMAFKKFMTCSIKNVFSALNVLYYTNGQYQLYLCWERCGLFSIQANLHLSQQQ